MGLRFHNTTYHIDGDFIYGERYDDHWGDLLHN